MFASASDTLVEEATGVFVGAVYGGRGTLKLAGDVGAGSISGIGSQFEDFATIDVESGAAWIVAGSNTVASSTVLTNNGKLTNTGTLTNDGTLVLAGQAVNSGTIVNDAKATLTFDGDYSITTDPATKTGTIINSGTIQKTSGTGTSIVRTGTGKLTDTGTIDVETGTLDLTGIVTVKGAIKGAGTIEFGPGSTMVNAGTSFTVSAVLIAGAGATTTLNQTMSYAEGFSVTTGGELVLTASHFLTLSGMATFNHGTVDGTGRLTTNGATAVSLSTLGGTAQWMNAGTVTETGTFTLGDAAGNVASFTNLARGVFDLDGTVGIASGKSTKAKLTNQGVLEKTAGAASVVSIGIVNTGTIAAASGTLDFQGTVTGSGKATITNKAILEFDGSVALGTAVSFGTGGGTLLLKAAPSFAGTTASLGAGDTLDVGNLVATGYTYTVNSQKSGGTLKLTNGSTTESLKLVGTYTSIGFHLTKGKSGDTLVSYATPSSAEHPTAVEPQPVVQPVGSHDAHMNALTAALFDGAFAPSMTTEMFAVDMGHHYVQAAMVASAGPGHR